MLSSTAAKKNHAPAPHPKAQPTEVLDMNAAAIAKAMKAVVKSKALGKVYEEPHSSNVAGAKTKYDIGKLVGQVRDDAQKYGRRSGEPPATLLRFDKATLNRYALVRKAWNARDVSAVPKLNAGTSLGQTFSHLIPIAQADARRRDPLAKRTLDQPNFA